MNLGQRLLELRKKQQLSQEEVAEKLDVTRQTISKWETGQSTPDFDKILPLCELYGITSDELLKGTKKKVNENICLEDDIKLIKKKKASGIGIGILLYFIGLSWVMISIPVLQFNPIVSSAIFLLICGIATYVIVYTCIIYKEEKSIEEKRENTLQKQIESVIATITVIVYLVISFATMAWHITWIIWVVFGLISEILKLIFMLRGNNNEE